MLWTLLFRLLLLFRLHVSAYNFLYILMAILAMYIAIIAIIIADNIILLLYFNLLMFCPCFGFDRCQTYPLVQFGKTHTLLFAVLRLCR